jgi:hypothetical protein
VNEKWDNTIKEETKRKIRKKGEMIDPKEGTETKQNERTARRENFH